MENTIETTAVLQLFGNLPMNIAKQISYSICKNWIHVTSGSCIM